jgi:hypothetical protein
VARPRSYDNVDGVGELSVGVMCVGYALILRVLIDAPAESAWHRYVVFEFFGLVALIHYGAKAIKTRITYPRTGFVEYRKQRGVAAIAAGLGALAAAGIWVGFRRHWNPPLAAASLVGPALAVAYGWRFAAAVRWKWAVAGAMAAASVGMEFVAQDAGGALFLTLTACGAMLIISGGISFGLYLRRTETPVQDRE